MVIIWCRLYWTLIVLLYIMLSVSIFFQFVIALKHLTTLTLTNVFHNPVFNLDIWPSKAFAYLDKHLSNKLCTKLQRINVYFEIFCLFRQIAFIHRETFLNVLLPHFSMAYAFIPGILILGLIVSHKSFGFLLNLEYSCYCDVHDIHGCQRSNLCSAFSFSDTWKFRLTCLRTK